MAILECRKWQSSILGAVVGRLPGGRIAVEAVTERERGRQSLFHRGVRTHSFSCSADRVVCLRVENIHDEMIINIAEDGAALGVVLAFSASQKNSSLVKNLKVDGRNEDLFPMMVDAASSTKRRRWWSSFLSPRRPPAQTSAFGP